MKLRLVDLNPAVVEAWKSFFAVHPEVDVVSGSILDSATVAMVSPANSHGFMDGGIDLVYLKHFGQQLEDRVRGVASRRPERMIPVGTAELIDTGRAHIPFLIVAPTMEMPGPVPPIHARRALTAVLRLADRHDFLSDICCPGLCTGVGRVFPQAAAREMELAYREWKESDPNERRARLLGG